MVTIVFAISWRQPCGEVRARDAAFLPGSGENGGKAHIRDVTGVEHLVNPRRDRTTVLEHHARDRRVLRGLAYLDLVRVVRHGAWMPRDDGLWDVAQGARRVRPEIGQCHLFTVTVMRA